LYTDSYVFGWKTSAKISNYGIYNLKMPYSQLQRQNCMETANINLVIIVMTRKKKKKNDGDGGCSFIAA